MKNIIISFLCLATVLLSDSSLGTAAPNLSLKLLDGKEIELYDLLENGPVLVDFWATWCAPCKKEMVFLDRFHQKYSEYGFNVLAISTDSPKSISKVKIYIRTKKFTFIVGLDPNQQVAQKMNAILLPTSILINKNREIVWFHQGYIPGDEVEIEKQIRLVLSLDPEKKEE